MKSQTVRRAPSSMRTTPTLGRNSFLRVRPHSPWSQHFPNCGPLLEMLLFLYQMVVTMRTLRMSPWVQKRKTPSLTVITGSLWGWWPGKYAWCCRAPNTQEHSLSSLFSS